MNKSSSNFSIISFLRFGSLDRRKNRRIQKRVSPNADNKSATLAAISYSVDQKKVAVMHSPQV